MRLCYYLTRYRPKDSVYLLTPSEGDDGVRRIHGRFNMPDTSVSSRTRRTGEQLYEWEVSLL